MPLYLPRRHRRKLLFPPGLLALAGLLWLGCLALSAHPEQLKRRNVMQLTMPPRLNSDIVWQSLYQDSGPQLRYSTMKHLRNWQTVEFGHGNLFDTLAARDAEAILRPLAAGWENTPDRDGLRIYFGPQARYASMVRVLDLMNRYNVKKYFFDARHPLDRTIFYAFSGSLRPQRWADPLLTPAQPPPLSNSFDTEPVLPVSTWWVRLTTLDNWWPTFNNPTENWQLLTSPEWCVLLILLAGIAILAVWRWWQLQPVKVSVS